MFDPELQTDSPTFQLDPQRSPFFRITQPDSAEVWKEVGFVWVIGASRTSSVEYWYLYNTVPAGSSMAVYAWPAANRAGAMRLTPVTPPAGQTQYTLPKFLAVEKGVTLTSVSATVAPLTAPRGT